jgi:uncharacterized membrane protein (UPF0182 family)
VFPGVVKPRSDIPPDLLAHFRYPEDMFKVQRSLLAAYHVLDPRTFYEGNDQWDIPEDPNLPTRKQPAYRLSVATQTGEHPVFSLTSVFVPAKKQNLSAFVAVGADAADKATYGKFQILRLPDTNQVSGPSQIASKFSSDPAVAAAVRNFKQNDAKVEYGNLLTLPVGGGLLYVQPLYTVRQAGAGNYPTLQYVLVSFGDKVGIGPDLTAALKVVLGAAPPTVPTEPGTGTGGTGGTTELPTGAVVLLQQANDKFLEAETALKAGDLQTYATKVEEARKLVEQALAAGKKKP